MVDGATRMIKWRGQRQPMPLWPLGLPLFTGVAHKSPDFLAYIWNWCWSHDACNRQRLLFLRPKLGRVGFLHALYYFAGKEDWRSVRSMCRSCPSVCHFSSENLDRGVMDGERHVFFLASTGFVRMRRHRSRVRIIYVSIGRTLCARKVRCATELAAWVRVCPILRVCVLSFTHGPG